jgi:hypothetical protein
MKAGPGGGQRIEEGAMMRRVTMGTVALLFAMAAHAQTTDAVPAAPGAPAPAAVPVAPALSPAPATAPASAIKPVAKRPDKMICEHEEVLGSRLGGHRVCKPASQWAEERQQARAAVDRAQTNRGCGAGFSC